MARRGGNTATMRGESATTFPAGEGGLSNLNFGMTNTNSSNTVSDGGSKENSLSNTPPYFSMGGFVSDNEPPQADRGRRSGVSARVLPAETTKEQTNVNSNVNTTV